MVNFDKEIRPFFQVIINAVDKKFDSSLFTTAFVKTIDEKNKLSELHNFTILQKDIEQSFIAIHVKHKYLPTWFNADIRNVNINSAPANIINIENDIILIYFNEKEKYIFIHSNCAQLLTLISETSKTLIEAESWKFKNLSAEVLTYILGQLKLEFRTLGILNVFNAGGVAPEAKAYFARNSGYCLTPTFDSGFGFSYGLGAMTDQSTNRKIPFGCSLKKSKVWSSWVSDLNEFCNKCDQILKWSKSPSKVTDDSLDILISPTTKDKIIGVDPIGFYLDYYIHNKGIVSLSLKDELFDWDCHLADPKSITFNINDNGKTTSLLVLFKYDSKAEEIVFSYPPGVIPIDITFNGIGEKTGSQDLVKYLNRQNNFTIIYGNAFAYRDNQCWLDNRLKQTFKKYDSKLIDWSDVDIKKEDRPPQEKGKKYNILDKIDLYFRSIYNKRISIYDNGANETADYIFLSDEKVILVHAKYSSSKTPGLRVDDLQVVTSQVLKNIQFFNDFAYSDGILTRLFNNCNERKSFKDFAEFKTIFLSILRNRQVEKECWLVQPGLSSSSLASRPRNKIHQLLNFPYSCCAVSQINFKVICS